MRHSNAALKNSLKAIQSQIKCNKYAGSALRKKAQKLQEQIDLDEQPKQSHLKVSKQTLTKTIGQLTNQREILQRDLLSFKIKIGKSPTKREREELSSLYARIYALSNRIDEIRKYL